MKSEKDKKILLQETVINNLKNENRRLRDDLRQFRKEAKQLSENLKWI